jgi:hypothetical protein
MMWYGQAIGRKIREMVTDLHGNELKSGAIITAEQTRLRIRTFDNREE